MRRPLFKLVALCLLLLAMLPQQRASAPPIISPSATPQADWTQLRIKLDEQAYREAAVTTTRTVPPPTTVRRRSALGPMDGDRFDRLAQCESGGDPTRVDKTGRVRGAFQWLLSTWHSAGGAGDPIDASYGEQKSIAMSWATVADPFSQWPVCWPKSA